MSRKISRERGVEKKINNEGRGSETKINNEGGGGLKIFLSPPAPIPF